MTSEPTPSVPAASSRGAALFRHINRFTITPILRAGLGAWISSPIGGYLLLLSVRGRKSGKLHHVPLSYLIADGAVWVTAAEAGGSQWYRNVQANPEVDVVLPAQRRLRLVAETVTDPDVRASILPRFGRSMGLPALMGGINPWRASDEAIIQAFEAFPLIALRPVDEEILEPGGDDPGGFGWVFRQGLILFVSLGTLRAAFALLRGTLRRVLFPFW